MGVHQGRTVAMGATMCQFRCTKERKDGVNECLSEQGPLPA